MSKRYPGNFITGNPVALSQTSNNGIWDVKDNYTATGNGTWQESDGIYEIGKSLRFRANAPAYLSRTPTTSSNQKTWTISCWVKRGRITNDYQRIFSARGNSGELTESVWENAGGAQDALVIENFTGGVQSRLVSSGVYRDPSAWYHIVYAYDTTQAIDTNRVKVYVNGTQITFRSGSYPAQNVNTYVNSTQVHKIGNGTDYPVPFDGYMAEFNLIDGQQLDASYFGYFDPVTNIWQPKPYTGSYGTNGFYLPFSETDTLKNLGRNFAGGTNFCPYSESVGSWGNASNCTITSNTTTAPNGTTTAGTITAGTTAAAYTRQDTGINMGISTYYTMSVYLKAGTATTVTVSDGYGTGANATIDLTTGAITYSYNPYGYIDAKSTFVGNGWYRMSLSFITHSSSDYNIGLRIDPGRSYGGTGASGASVYVWGAQINLGKTADPYFPNNVSTRADNNWTPNNISLTAGVTYDSMVDSPTNVFTTATEVGGVVPGNYCTLNPLHRSPSTPTSIEQAGLYYNNTNASSAYPAYGSMVAVGKLYYEVTLTGGLQGAYPVVGFGRADSWSGNIPGNTTEIGGFGYQAGNGAIYANGSAGTSVASATTNDIIGIAYDQVTGYVWVSKNGTWLGSGNPSAGTNPAATITTTKDYVVAAVISYNSANFHINFGQRPFSYAPPTGFKSWNTTSLHALGTTAVGKAAITPNKWFDINLYGGLGTDQNIVNSGFQPDLVWIKNRSSGSAYHILTDSVRGPRAELYTNSTANEGTRSTDGLSSFNSNGFTLNSSNADYNGAGTSYVAWQWKQSPIAGFNIVSYTGDGSNNRAISHNLGAAPKMIMIKGRNDGGGNGFIYWHSALPTKAEYLASPTSFQVNNYAAYSLNEPASSGTVPTSSSFYVSASGRSYNSNATNGNGYNYVAYLWTEVPGFSKFGSYVGNGSSDGVFVYCGFRPKYILFKRDSTEVFVQSDIARTPYNSANYGWYLTPSGTAADANNSVVYDFLSNGFKIRNNSQNESGSTYTYVAFAESPFALNNRAR